MAQFSYSPESNGMGEAFVKIFKRDYISRCESTEAITLMKDLPGMMSPREFIRVVNGG